MLAFIVADAIELLHEGDDFGAGARGERGVRGYVVGHFGGFDSKLCYLSL